jgi:hypothetical protein
VAAKSINRAITVIGVEPCTCADTAASLWADVITDLAPSRMTRELGQGRLLMASVHKEIRRPDREPPWNRRAPRPGHRHHDNQVTFHNPSGYTPQAGIATLPMTVFDRFAAHRGVALHSRPVSLIPAHYGPGLS